MISTIPVNIAKLFNPRLVRCPCHTLILGAYMIIPPELVNPSRGPSPNSSIKYFYLNFTRSLSSLPTRVRGSWKVVLAESTSITCGDKGIFNKPCFLALFYVMTIASVLFGVTSSALIERSILWPATRVKLMGIFRTIYPSRIKATGRPIRPLIIDSRTPPSRKA